MTENRAINNQTISRNTYIKLGFYTILMAVCPLLSFFLSRHYLQYSIGYDHLAASIRAAGVAVVFAHIVIGMFIYSAWKEDPEEIIQTKKKD